MHAVSAQEVTPVMSDQAHTHSWQDACPVGALADQDGKGTTARHLAF